MGHFELHKQFVSPEQIEQLLDEALRLRIHFYDQENLSTHVAYLSDRQPHRVSHAFAIGHSKELQETDLPFINYRFWRNPRMSWRGIEELAALTDKVQSSILGLPDDSRMLFNIQEYYAASEPVAKHYDGELLEFTTEKTQLNIKRGLRPKKVAVLTLVNSTDGGGTRIYMPDGSEEVVQAQAGDLLVFDNANCFHGVDQLTGHARRADGILREIIGWRSLDAECLYMEEDKASEVTKDEARAITRTWLKSEWPEQWNKIRISQQKAAF